jgi:hypothetical protein
MKRIGRVDDKALPRRGPTFAMRSTFRPAKAPRLHECEIIAVEREILFDEVAVTLMRLYIADETFISHLITPSFSRLLRGHLLFS